MKRKAILLALASFLLLSSIALAMSPPSHQYKLGWFTPLTGSGGSSASAHYAVQFTIGQSDIGNMGSAHYTTCLGYWCGGGHIYSVYLPTMSKRH